MDKRLAQDEDIFQTARLINCGWFGSAVFSDYFSAILGLVRQGSSWSLSPFGVSSSSTLTQLCTVPDACLSHRKSEMRTTRCLNAGVAMCVVSR